MRCFVRCEMRMRIPQARWLSFFEMFQNPGDSCSKLVGYFFRLSTIVFCLIERRLSPWSLRENQVLRRVAFNINLCLSSLVLLPFRSRVRIGT